MPDAEHELETIAACLSRLGVPFEPLDRSAWKKRRGNRFAQRDVLAKNLLDFKAVLDRKDISFLLAQGTLLAVVRDGQFFAHTMDCDLYVYWDDRYQLAYAVEDLARQGFRVIKLIERPHLKKITFEREYEWIDINFLVSRGRGLLRHWRVRRKRFPAKFFDAGEPIQFLDHTFFAPCNIPKYLKRRYGAGWRMPVYKLVKPASFDRIREKLETGDLLCAVPSPLWPLSILKFCPITLTKFQGTSSKGSVALIYSGDQICLRYVCDTRADGAIQVHGTDPRTSSIWWPASAVLARAARLYTDSGIVIPLDGWAARQAFRFCSVLAVTSIRCIHALRLTS